MNVPPVRNGAANRNGQDSNERPGDDPARAEAIGRRPAEEPADAAARTDTARPPRPASPSDKPRRVSITGTNVAKRERRQRPQDDNQVEQRERLRVRTQRREAASRRRVQRDRRHPAQEERHDRKPGDRQQRRPLEAEPLARTARRAAGRAQKPSVPPVM